MSAAWNVEFYEADEGCPVRGFLDGLGREQRAKVLEVAGRRYRENRDQDESVPGTTR
jgi:hypothetical protein